MTDDLYRYESEGAGTLDAWPVYHKCCETFADATEGRTDNEGYEALIYATEEGVMIGYSLPAISFCPWCAAPIKNGEST